MKNALILFLLVLATSIVVANSGMAASPSPEELSIAKQWTTKHWDSAERMPDAATFPFSFVYDGKTSVELLPQWDLKLEQRAIDAARTERVVRWSDPLSGLTVRCVVVEYNDFPAVEWTLYFKNESNEMSSLLKDIQALDTQFERQPGDEFTLYGTKGDWCAPDSFEPFVKRLESGAAEHFAPYGGRPTNAAFPYYNLQMPGGGILLAIGWPGQWASSFVRDQERGRPPSPAVHITAGQELLCTSLKPGEEIRSPLIAMVFWHGSDVIRSQNLWRNWMVAHNLPRTADGKLPPTQIVACSSHQFKEMTQANEENQKFFVDRYLEEGMKLDYWWMDAGWYPCKGEWTNTGTWEPDPARFPNGLRAVSDHAHAKDIKIITWFEPERVGDRNSWLAQEHPEWLLWKKADIPEAPKGGNFGSGPGRLLDLGNAEARNWLIEHVDRTLREQGIDLYRQDFNMDPLPFWRGADAPNRQGMTENLYVQGYLAYWDALRQRHPNLRIDSCASGGRRDDLETLRRAVPLIRSDHLFEPTSQQNHHFAFASWIPYHGAGYVTGPSAIGAHGSPDVEAYSFRSNMSPSVTLCFDMRKKELDYRLAERLFKQLKTIQPNYLGDFYPLTSYSLANDVWLAWQYDRAETGSGVVQAFRRPECREERMTFKLCALDPEASYEITNFDLETTALVSGNTLLNDGLAIEIKDKPGAAVITYRLVESVTRNASYYLSALGDDAHSGTSPEEAWKTVGPLNKMKALGEGCKVLFNGGDTFDGGLELTMTGSAEAPCVIGSYGTGKAVISDNNAKTKPLFLLRNSQYVTIQNLKFAGTLGENYGSRAFVPGNKTMAICIQSDRSIGARFRAINVDNVEISHTFGGLCVEAGVAANTDGFDGVSVTGCTFDSTYQQGCYVLGYGILNGGPVDQHLNVRVAGNIFRNIKGDPHFPSEAQALSVSNATGIVIENNRFADNCGYGGAFAGTPNGGSAAFGVSNCRNFRILHNEVTGTKCTVRYDGCAIDADQDAQLGEIAFNLTYNNDGPGLQLGSFKSKTTSHIDVHHNVSYNDARGCRPDSIQGAIRLFGGVTSCNFFNNTIYVDAAGTQGAPSCLNLEDCGGGANKDLNVWNNIFKTTGGIPMIRPNVPGEYNPTRLDASIIFISNCYDSSGAPLLISTDAFKAIGNVTSLAEWRACGAEMRNGEAYGIVSDAGLSAMSLFNPPPNGFLPRTPLNSLPYFDLSASSDCSRKAVDPWPMSYYATKADFHGNEEPIHTVGAITQRN